MKFTLVIPLAPDRNAEVLESIRNLNYPKSEYHIIVVKGLNPSDNRNRGASKARGEIIAFLDDDAVLDSEILNKAENFFKEHKDIDVVGGPQLTPFDDVGFAKFSGYALGSKWGGWELSHRYSVRKEKLDADERDVTSANLFCKREVMGRVKFDTNLFPGEDPKFIEDLKKAGFKVAYSPELIVYHRRRPTMGLMIKQMFNYGKVRPFKEPFLQTIKIPYFVMPSLFFIYLIVLFVLFGVNRSITGNAINFNYLVFDKIPYFSFITLFPLLLYVVIAMSFAAYDSVKNKDLRAFFVLPFIYPMIKLSYGAGMIYGYFKKVVGR